MGDLTDVTTQKCFGFQGLRKRGKEQIGWSGSCERHVTILV